jgi:hypothetical protein
VRRLPSRATVTLAAVVLSAAPLAAACEAGLNANVKNERFAEGTYVKIGKLRLQNVLLQPPVGQSTIQGTASLTFSVFNDGDTKVELTGISSDSGGQVVPGSPSASASPSGGVSTTPSVSSSSTSSSSSSSSSPSSSASPSAAPTTATPSAAPARALPVPIPPGGAVIVGPTGTTQLELTGLDQPVSIGRTLFLTFQFSPGGSSGRIPVPVTANIDTTATSTPTSESPSSFPPDSIDPSWYQTPFDDRDQSRPPEPAGH